MCSISCIKCATLSKIMLRTNSIWNNVIYRHTWYRFVSHVRVWHTFTQWPNQLLCTTHLTSAVRTYTAQLITSRLYSVVRVVMLEFVLYVGRLVGGCYCDSLAAGESRWRRAIARTLFIRHETTTQCSAALCLSCRLGTWNTWVKIVDFFSLTIVSSLSSLSATCDIQSSEKWHGRRPIH